MLSFKRFIFFLGGAITISLLLVVLFAIVEDALWYLSDKFGIPFPKRHGK
jgi:hypothetical protein